MVKESLCVCFLTEPSLWLLSVPVLMIWGPLVLVGLHDPSQSDQKTSHGGGRRAENWRSFSSKVLAFSVPNATRLAAVPGTPHNHKYEKVHLQFTSSGKSNNCTYIQMVCLLSKRKRKTFKCQNGIPNLFQISFKKSIPDLPITDVLLLIWLRTHHLDDLMGP